MDPNSQEYVDLYSYVASLTPEVYKSMKAWEAERLVAERKMAGANPCSNPCAAKNPCAGQNPCAAINPCAGR